MSKPAEMIHEAECPWESGALGLSEEHAVAVSDAHEKEIDESLDLVLMSIRLPKALINDLKFIAKREGLGYQPLMRRVLIRFVSSEMKSIARQELVRGKYVDKTDDAQADDDEPVCAVGGAK